MKKLGLLGGVAWASTVDYYAGLCRRAEAHHRASGSPGPVTYPEMVIESLNLSKAVGLWGDDANEPSWHAFDRYHRDALLRLEAAGADFALMASNSPHHRFAEIIRGVRLPVLSIIAAAAAEAGRHGIRRLLLFGTPLTMRSARFREGFAQAGINADAPADACLRAQIELLIGRLQQGRTTGAAEELRDLALKARPDIAAPGQAICLGCTELPLAFEDPDLPACFQRHGLTYLNSNAAHIDAAFAALMR